MTFAAAERRRLADLFHELGPDVATLCEGWSAHHLAAHLYIRENQPVAVAGMFVAPLQARLDNAMDRQLSRDFHQVVDDWAAGPGGTNPLRLVDARINTAEHFVHHEDLRRGGGMDRSWYPRDFSRAVDDQLYSILATMGRAMLKGSELPVILTAEGRQPVVAADRRGVAERGDDVVRVNGQPGELLVWTFGRDEVEVGIEGDVTTVRR